MDLVAGGLALIGGLVWTYETVAELVQPQLAKRDRNDVDWDVSDQRKGHIWNGSKKNDHASRWRKLGFDPKNPKDWNVLLPILQEAYEKGAETMTRNTPQGVAHTFSYYSDKLQATIEVVIIELEKSGIWQLSDAWANI